MTVLILVGAVVIAVACNAAIAAIAHAAGAPDEFKPLHIATYAALTVLGMALAALVWALIRARSARPRTVLGRLIPAVVLLSLVPDIMLGLGKQQPGTTWGGVLALMIMHLTVAAVSVGAFALTMPVRDTAPRD